MKNSILKDVAFFLIGIILFSHLTNIIRTPLAVDFANGTGREYANKYKNEYDVLLLGASPAVSNIYSQELYEEYGIAAVSLGIPLQPTFLSFYTLVDALTLQTPKVVIFDARSLFYDEDYVRDILNRDSCAFVHFSVDNMKSAVKRQALLKTQNYVESLEFWDYFSTWYYCHTNWKRLDKFNFVGYDERFHINGNLALFDITEVMNIYGNEDEQYIIPDINVHAFKRIANLCGKEDIQLVCATDYVDITAKKAEEISKLCKEVNVPYINVNEHIDEIGFNFATDCNDGVHFNLNGSIKWTGYVGKFLKENYEIDDKRNQVSKISKVFEKNSDIYHYQLKLMATEQNLLSALTFEDYMQELSVLDLEENAVFISVHDDAVGSLSDNGMALMSDLGLCTELRGQFSSSYAAVLLKDDIREAFSTNETVELRQEEEPDGFQYDIMSSGYNAGGNSSIIIKGQDYIQRGRGFNIVVYNFEWDRVISSVFFDTCAEPNPATQRNRTVTTYSTNQEIETEPNVWKMKEEE